MCGSSRPKLQDHNSCCWCGFCSTPDAFPSSVSLNRTMLSFCNNFVYLKILPILRCVLIFGTHLAVYASQAGGPLHCKPGRFGRQRLCWLLLPSLPTFPSFSLCFVLLLLWKGIQNKLWTPWETMINTWQPKSGPQWEMFWYKRHWSRGSRSTAFTGDCKGDLN